MTLGTLEVQISAATAGFEAAMQGVRARLAAGARDVASFQQRMQGIGQAMQSAGASMTAAVTLPLAGLATAAVTTAARFDGLKRALQAQAGSAEGAARQFERLREVAKLPGLGLEEAIQGSVRLQAAGFAAEGAERAMKAFGNAIAISGGGRADLDGVTYALKQMAGETKLLKEDFNMITERVPQAKDALMQAFGTSNTEQLAKMGVTSQQAIDVIIKGLERLPQATGGLGNAIENALDAAKLSLVTLGDTLNQTLNLEGVADRFAAFAERATTAFQAFTEANPTLARVALAVAGVAAAFGPVLTVAGAAVAAIGALGAPVVAVAAAVGGLVAVGAGVAAAWKNVTDTTQGVGRVMQQAGTAFNTLRAIGSEAMQMLRTSVERAAGQIRPTLASLSAFWEKHGEAIMAAVRAITRATAAAFGAVVEAVAAAVRTVAALLNGDWRGAWEGLKGIVVAALRPIVPAVASMVAAVAERLGDLARNLPLVGNSIGNALDGIAERARSAAAAIAGARREIETPTRTNPGGVVSWVGPRFTMPQPKPPAETPTGSTDLFRPGASASPAASGAKKDAPDVAPAEQRRREAVARELAALQTEVDAMSEGLQKAIARAGLDYKRAMEEASQRYYRPGSATMGAVPAQLRANLERIRAAAIEQATRGFGAEALGRQIEYLREMVQSTTGAQQMLHRAELEFAEGSQRLARFADDPTFAAYVEQETARLEDAKRLALEAARVFDAVNKTTAGMQVRAVAPIAQAGALGQAVEGAEGVAQMVQRMRRLREESEATVPGVERITKSMLAVPPLPPSLLASMDAFRVKMANIGRGVSAVGVAFNLALGQAVPQMVDGLASSLGNLATGLSSVSDTLRSIGQIARRVVADLAAAVAKALILKGLKVALGGATGGLGGFLLGALGANRLAGGAGLASLPAANRLAAAPQRLEIVLRPQVLPTGQLSFAVAEDASRTAASGIKITTLAVGA